jgi:hypothetical protein
VNRTRWKAATTVLGFALAALGAGACGSSDDTTTVEPPAVSAATADRLAKLSNRIADELDVGDSCNAAHAADDLSAAVEESDLPASLRPGVETVATDLVNQVNCPPPPPPPEPEPEPEEDKKRDKEKKEEGDEHKDQHGDEGGKEGKDQPPGHGGVPPGQAKLKGEEG